MYIQGGVARETIAMRKTRNMPLLGIDKLATLKFIWRHEGYKNRGVRKSSIQSFIQLNSERIIHTFFSKPV